MGCGLSKANLRDRKGNPTFASGIGPIVFMQFFTWPKAELSDPCQFLPERLTDDVRFCLYTDPQGMV